VSFAAITLYISSQRVFIVAVVYFVMTQSGNFWIHPRTILQQRSMLYINPIPEIRDFHGGEELSRSLLGCDAI
jgi:hypothetical protein